LKASASLLHYHYELSFKNRKKQDTISIEDGEKILDALRRAKIKAPSSCRNGNCMICESTLTSDIISESYRTADGTEYFLPCKNIALSDCHFSFLNRQNTNQTNLLTCQALSVKKNGASFQLHLLLPAGKQQEINTKSISTNLPEKSDHQYNLRAPSIS
tara:strand:- start:1369 stop:1845 length:477 start_codon:yes stop_codon:yes gene_type:complete